MITHIVFFKLKDKSPENIKKAKNVLDSLRGRVEVLRHLEVGMDVLRSERSYDIALTARFDSLEDLKTYATHPEHVKVVDYIATVKESSITVDYINE